MHLILTGATGLVGSAALSALLTSKSITKISIISRRPVRQADDAHDSRVNVIIHKDFTKFNDTELLDKLKDASGCIWALGISQTQVSADEYVKITKDYTLAAANAFASLPPAESSQATSERQPFHFLYVSGDGATHQPGRFTPTFGRVKGETELALAEIHAQHPHFRVATIRPGVVDATQDEAIKGYVPARAGGAIMKPIEYGLMRLVPGYWSAPTKGLGQALVQMAMGAWESKYERVGGSSLVSDGALRVVDNQAWKKLLSAN